MIPNERLRRRLGQLEDEQLFRLYRKIWNKIQKACQGGMTFGVDERTLKITNPKLAATWRQVYDEIGIREAEHLGQL